MEWHGRRGSRNVEDRRGRGGARAGGDTLMRNAGRAVVPDAFTHGSSEQRMEWFQHGFQSGQLAQCDTFKAAGM